MQKMRILFVDDDRPVLEALRRSLFRQAEAWDMTFFTDPAAAAAAFAEAPFDVVVTDLQMPGMNGLELAQVVKMHDPAAQIIVLTGTADLVQAIDAINEAGAFRFYTKPCPTGRIAEGISAALSERERRAGGAAAIGEAALNRLPVGVIVVDAATQVIFMNPPGARIVAAGDGLRLDRQRVLRADGLDDTAALHHAVAVLSRSQVSLAAQVLVIERPSLARPFTLRAEAMTGTGEDGKALVLLFVTDPERPPEVSAPVLSEIFGLTEQESRLAAALARGATTEQAAAELNVTISTARTYLKQIYLKTETSRQAGLVKLILTSAAAL